MKLYEHSVPGPRVKSDTGAIRSRLWWASLVVIGIAVVALVVLLVVLLA